MGWFNYVGLCIMAVMMVPNIIFACVKKDGFKNSQENILLEKIEQVGRFGSFIFMIINVPILTLISFLTARFGYIFRSRRCYVWLIS